MGTGGTRPSGGRGVGGLAATALGLSVGVALAVFVLAPEVAGSSGTRARALGSFALAAVSFLPLLIAHTQRASVRTRGADLFGSIAGRGRRSPWIFLVGWVAIGGYLVTGALLAEAVAERIALFGRPLIDAPLAAHHWLLVTVALLALQEVVGERQWWGTRTVLVLLAVLGTAAVLGLQLATRGVTETAPTGRGLVDRWVGIVAMAGTVAWFSDVVLARVRELARPHRSGPAAVLGGWLVAMVLGALASLPLRERPGGALPDVESILLTEHHPVEAAGVVAGLVLCWMGLTRLVRSGGRLVYAMRRGGYFEPLVSKEETGRPTRAFVVGAILAVPLILRAPTTTLIEASSAAFLAASVLAFLPPAFSEDAARQLTPAGRPLRVTRLWSSLGLGVAVLLLVALPKQAVAALSAWIVIGLAARWVLGVRAESAAERESEEEGEDASVAEEEAEGRAAVLAAHLEGGDLRTLARVAAGMTRGTDAKVLLLGVVVVEEEVPYDRLHARAARLRMELRRRIDALPEARGVVHVVVRVAPSLAQAIVDAADEWDVDHILVDWHRGHRDAREQVIEDVFGRTQRSLGVVFGQLRDRPPRVVLAAADRAKALAALPFARGLAQADDTPIEVVRVLVGASEAAAEEPGEEAPTPETLGLEASGANVVALVRHGLQVWPTLREASAEAPLVLGASVDPLLERAVFGGMPFEVATGRLAPTIVVKGAERSSAFWLRRMWDVLTHPFPPLSEAERVDVLAAMRLQAKADVDFTVLMVISSLIAITGLVQDSSAVVIGAMIMAPLMAPIVAVAHGIALGSPPLIQRGTNTVLRGAVTAVLVATLVTSALPIQEAPREVLARVQPNLLDLVVALAAGAAAAYAAARRSTAAALPGVAIAVALVPPLCVVGFGLGSGAPAIAGGALLLFGTNLIGITLVAAAFFLLLGFRPPRANRAERVRRGIVAASAGILLLAIPLALATQSSFAERQVHWRLLRSAEPVEALAPVEVREVEVAARGGRLEARVTVYAFRALTEAEEERLVEALVEAARAPVALRLVVLRAERVGPTGPE